MFLSVTFILFTATTIFFNRAFVLSNLVLSKLSAGQNMSRTQSSGFSGATGDFATNKTCSNQRQYYFISKYLKLIRNLNIQVNCFNTRIETTKLLFLKYHLFFLSKYYDHYLSTPFEEEH